MSSFQSECPICGGPLTLSQEPLLGELLDCTGCGGELEVKSKRPLLLAEAPQVAEDWGQ